MTEYPDSAEEALVRATANYVQTTTDPNAVLLVVIRTPEDGDTSDIVHLVVLFCRGSELPTNIFGEFLSITPTTNQLGPMGYLEVSNITPGGDRGSGQTFLGTAFNGGVDQYLDAWRHWKNFTSTFKDQVNATGNTLAFTPVLDSQIAAGIADGGNAIDPPSGPYTAVLFRVQSPISQFTVPAEVERGRQLLLKQTPPSPGIPIYLNECDKTQNAFSTYGGYEFLKRTYAKYNPTRFNVRFTEGPIGL